MGKIIRYHILILILGSAGIGFYFFLKISALNGVAGLATIALFPVAIVYIAGFAILCLVSLAIFLFVRFLRRS